MRPILLFFAFILQSTIALADTTEALRLATTTSVRSSGLLNHLLPIFNRTNPVNIEVSVVGSGKALRLARKGKADAVWVHSPSAEIKFMNEGYGQRRIAIMRNDFVLIGPKEDPAQIANLNNAITAISRIKNSESKFVSRGDDSGTHKKELELWRTANQDPYGHDWYIETGAGMGATLSLAIEEKAYMLIDRATFVVKGHRELAILVEDGENLKNVYSIISVNPHKVPDTHIQQSEAFIDWLISARGQNAIAEYRFEGARLYQPMQVN